MSRDRERIAHHKSQKLDHKKFIINESSIKYVEHKKQFVLGEMV